MFKQISIKIALQFTAFVFVLFLVNGALFLAADFGNARRQSQMRLNRTLHLIIDRPNTELRQLIPFMRPTDRERIRIVDAEGEPLYSGAFFNEVPFRPSEGFTSILAQDEQYLLLTTAILDRDRVIGYLQIADVERLQQGDLPLRASLYLLVSAGISALTFFAGLVFARRSLRPAADMMQQLEQFTQDASHELRTPIAVVNSSLDLALKTGKYKEGILSAKEDLKQISSLVERLLELARLEKFTLARSSIDLSVLVRQSIEKHRLLANVRTITIEESIDDGVVIAGDESFLRQVIGNLLSNAIKFNKDSGTIRVRLTKKLLSVEDTGSGIAAEDLPHIFDRFYQADESRSRGGLGLGLALVKRICELHNWSIDAVSKKGNGTTFTIRFQ